MSDTSKDDSNQKVVDAKQILEAGVLPDGEYDRELLEMFKSAGALGSEEERNEFVDKLVDGLGGDPDAPSGGAEIQVCVELCRKAVMARDLYLKLKLYPSEKVTEKQQKMSLALWRAVAESAEEVMVSHIDSPPSPLRGLVQWTISDLRIEENVQSIKDDIKVAAGYVMELENAIKLLGGTARQSQARAGILATVGRIHAIRGDWDRYVSNARRSISEHRSLQNSSSFMEGMQRREVGNVPKHISPGFSAALIGKESVTEASPPTATSDYLQFATCHRYLLEETSLRDIAKSTGDRMAFLMGLFAAKMGFMAEFIAREGLVAWHVQTTNMEESLREADKVPKATATIGDEDPKKEGSEEEKKVEDESEGKKSKESQIAELLAEVEEEEEPDRLTLPTDGDGSKASPQKLWFRAGEMFLHAANVCVASGLMADAVVFGAKGIDMCLKAPAIVRTPVGEDNKVEIIDVNLSPEQLSVVTELAEAPFCIVQAKLEGLVPEEVTHLFLQAHGRLTMSSIEDVE